MHPRLKSRRRALVDLFPVAPTTAASPATRQVAGAMYSYVRACHTAANLFCGHTAQFYTSFPVKSCGYMSAKAFSSRELPLSFRMRHHICTFPLENTERTQTLNSAPFAGKVVAHAQKREWPQQRDRRE